MRRALVAVTLLLTALTAPARASVDPRQVKAAWGRIATGLSGPVGLTAPDGDPRLFVVERPGRIRVIRNGVLKATPFLDITSRVNTSGEGGLLSLAFRPDYATRGFFYVAYTDPGMTLRVVRFHATPTSDVATAGSASLVFSVPHPTYTNHNGGQLAFGPSGYLFIGTGDGGGSGDPNGNAQNLRSLLGKILRIDVVHVAAGHTYSVPGDNPFAQSTTARHEIWHYGLRNPWRFSFDRGNPNLWIGDVGQADREEIDKIWSAGGLNFGWDCREGTLDTSSTYGGSYCKTTGYTPPIFQYTHDLGCAVIGGYVYRGTRYSSLVKGEYVFGDYCSGRLWLTGPDANGHLVTASLATFGAHILAFGRDAADELYICAETGNVYRMSFAHR